MFEIKVIKTKYNAFITNKRHEVLTYLYRQDVLRGNEETMKGTWRVNEEDDENMTFQFIHRHFGLFGNIDGIDHVTFDDNLAILDTLILFVCTK